MVSHRFGGSWTERKLAALKGYLVQYQKIFHANEDARKLRTIYVDAFAGTGERSDRESDLDSLFGYTDEAKQYQAGSADIALALEQKFHRYIFIDSKASHINALRAVVERKYPDLTNRCELVQENANVWLQNWCVREDWRANRAVVFLDPYGMSVEWKTIVSIANTKAIDLWVLFPFAIGVNRMMPNDELPETGWGEVITRVFGTTDWIKRNYRKHSEVDLFGDRHDSIVKTGRVGGILEFFVERLKTIFPHVVDKPLVLYNSNNSPMYALCFAAANPKGGSTALKIAAYLAGRR